MAVNKVILVGNLTRDAEVLGETGMKFSIATSEKYKNKEGEIIESVEYHNCIATKTGVMPYLVKGTQVYAEGKISTTKKDEKTYTNIRVFTLQLIGSKGGANTSPADVKSGASAMPDSSDADELPF